MFGTLFVGVFLALGRMIAPRVPQFLDWVGSLGAWSPAVFILGYAAGIVLFVPASILTLAAGAIFGVWAGTGFVFVAATMGSVGAFLLARSGLRDWVARKVAGDPRLGALDRAIADSGWRIVFLMRLSPVFPFTLLNYALGLTRVRLRDFILASIGTIPGTFAYVFYGKVAGDAARLAGGGVLRHDALYYVVLGLGVVATVIVTTIVTRMAREALKGRTG